MSTRLMGAPSQGRTVKGDRTWKIGRKLYNLEPFLDRHPGGAELLEMAYEEFGDATYAFESHHTDVKRTLRVLEKYRVTEEELEPGRPTICDDGPTITSDNNTTFFGVLKTRVGAYLRKTENVAGPTTLCIRLFWSFVAAWFCCFAGTVYTWERPWLNLACAALTGLCGAVLAGFGHNWSHQPKYAGWTWVLDLEGLDSLNWPLQHDLCHHMFTNLPSDAHWKILEPFLVTDPRLHRQRNCVQRYVTPYLAQIIFALGCMFSNLVFLVQIVLAVVDPANVDARKLHPRDVRFYPGVTLLALQLALLTYVHGWRWGGALFVLKSGIMSSWYLTLAFINHNSEAAWRINDRSKVDDWALEQLYSSSDIGEPGLSFLGSWKYLWLNYHTVHHLFPHTDMSKHPGIQNVLVEVCKEFGIKFDHGKSMGVLYLEMLETLRTPRDILNVMAQLKDL